MSDDFSNLRNFKKSPLPAADNTVILKKPATVNKTIKTKPKARMRFIITNNKNNSWVEDLYAQEQLNQMERVYH
ncbi:hypothetical protein [Desulfocastanea catecholica]